MAELERAGRTLIVAICIFCISCSGGSAPEGAASPDTSSEIGRRRALSPGVIFEMLRDNPDLVVLDVRPFADYVSETGHLKRAISLPAARLPRLWQALRLSRDETVLIYGDEESAHQEKAMRFLLDSGQRYVVQIEGGVEAWREGGFEVVIEDAPLSPVRINQAISSAAEAQSP